MEFIASIPWPSAEVVFGAMVVGFITTFVLAPWRNFSQYVWEQILPAKKMDAVITRFERNLIIKHHVIDHHKKPLAHCHQGFCSKLTPATSADQATAAAVQLDTIQ